MNRPLRRCILPALVGAALLAIDAEAQLLNVPLPDLPDNQEMLVLDIDLAPGHDSEPHRHNAHVFVYVVEGRVQMQVAGGELMTLSPGEMFYETPNDIHTVSRNASSTEPARILVHIVKTVGAAVSEPANDPRARP